MQDGRVDRADLQLDPRVSWNGSASGISSHAKRGAPMSTVMLPALSTDRLQQAGRASRS